MARRDNNKKLIAKERRKILHETLGDDLFKKVVAFFSRLFIGDSDEKPINNRSYIILTRKGFCLWQAAYLCGLLGDFFPNPDVVISDRKWCKMTIEERQVFTNGRDVFIVDDTITRGFSCVDIYNDIDPLICESRTVAVLNSSFGFTLSNSFENYISFGSISIDERRSQNAKIMVALYNLAIPFTAESPMYHSERIERSVLEAWLRLDGSEDSKGWKSEVTTLDFGGAGVVESTFLIHAPLIESAENFLFRGMRVCYRLLSKAEDPLQRYAEVSLVPWVMYDVIDYDESISYLLNYTRNGSWLYKQLKYGETDRKRIVVHRVISYLFSSCIAKLFFIDIESDQSKYENNSMTYYHFGHELYEDIKYLVNVACKTVNTSGCPFRCLMLTKYEHDKVAVALCGITMKGLDIPKRPESIDVLDNKLCLARERRFDETEKHFDKVDAFKLFPLICYTGPRERRGVEALRIARRSIASFHSKILSVAEKSYLVNALMPGEGSTTVMLKNYDFLWSLHYLFEKESYNADVLQEFADFWSEKREENEERLKKLSYVNEYMIRTCKNLTPCFWPNKAEIWRSLSDDAIINLASELAKEFLLKIKEGSNN